MRMYRRTQQQCLDIVTKHGQTRGCWGEKTSMYRSAEDAAAGRNPFKTNFGFCSNCADKEQGNSKCMWGVTNAEVGKRGCMVPDVPNPVEGTDDEWRCGEKPEVSAEKSVTGMTVFQKHVFARCFLRSMTGASVEDEMKRLTLEGVEKENFCESGMVDIVKHN